MNKSLLFLLLTAGLSQQVLASPLGDIGEEEKDTQKKTMHLVFDAEDKRLDTFHDGLPALPKEIWQFVIAKDFSVQDHYHLCLTHPYFYTLFSHFPGVHSLTFTQGKKAKPPQGLSHFLYLKKVTIGREYPHLRTALQNLLVALESLNLCKTRVKNKHLQHLPAGLEILDLSDTRVTGEGFQYLPQDLKSLELFDTRVTGEGFQHLPVGLKTLNLFDTDVTDEGLQHLPQSLEKLDLGLTSVTGAGLIKYLPSSLRVLQVFYDGITDDEIAALKARIPGLCINGCWSL